MLFLRWVVPEIHVVGEEGEVQWVEAQVPDITEEKRKRFYELAGSAWWDAGQAMSDSDNENTVVINRILVEKPYITQLKQFSSGNILALLTGYQKV